MKKSLTRKLFLSVAALAATAATLTSSTFAWYTANTEAQVNKVTASTEAKGSNSLFISAANAYADTKATDWDAYLAEATPHLVSAATLKPVYSNFSTAPIKAATTDPVAAAVEGRSYNAISKTTAQYSYAKTEDTALNATKTYYTRSDSEPYTYTPVTTPEVANIGTYYEQKDRIADKVDYADETAANFLEFVIRVRSGNKLNSNTPLYFSKFNLTSNVTSGSAAQIALASSGKTGISGAGSYSADLLAALKLDVTSKAVTLKADNTIPETATDGATSRLKGTGTDEVDTVTTYGFESMAAAPTNMAVTDDNNAIGYYNTVMNRNIAKPADDYVSETALYKLTTPAATNALAVATLPASGDRDFSVIEIRFVLYLDGWDNYCYDIMQNQTVNFEFELTTTASSSVMTATKPNA